MDRLVTMSVVDAQRLSIKRSSQSRRSRSNHSTLVEGYRAPEVCKIAGVTYRQLDYWARTEILVPSIHAAEGSGSQRLYSFNDLLLVRLIKSLLDNGLSMQGVRRALTTARELINRAPESLEYLVVSPNSVLVRDDNDVVDLLRSGQLAISTLISLGSLRDELTNDLETLYPAPVQPSLFTETRLAAS